LIFLFPIHRHYQLSRLHSYFLYLISSTSIATLTAMRSTTLTTLLAAFTCVVMAAPVPATEYGNDLDSFGPDDSFSGSGVTPIDIGEAVPCVGLVCAARKRARAEDIYVRELEAFAQSKRDTTELVARDYSVTPIDIGEAIPCVGLVCAARKRARAEDIYVRELEAFAQSKRDTNELVVRDYSVTPIDIGEAIPCVGLVCAARKRARAEDIYVRELEAFAQSKRAMNDLVVRDDSVTPIDIGEAIPCVGFVCAARKRAAAEDVYVREVEALAQSNDTNELDDSVTPIDIGEAIPCVGLVCAARKRASAGFSKTKTNGAKNVLGKLTKGPKRA